MSEVTDRRVRISVCICTYKRPSLLQTLLETLSQQSSDGFTFDVVVVDNDVERSGEASVRRVSEHDRLQVSYDCEPIRNISLARNRAIRNATGDVLAFIDDDELPDRDWLLHLHRTLKQYRVDGVLAPVLPVFPPAAPAWLAKADIGKRHRRSTGERITPRDCRTGNMLLDSRVFADAESWFDPQFGRTGGEDTDFFARQFRKGRTFVWCDDAIVRETVTPDRWTTAFYLKRMWRAGTIDGEWIRSGRLPGKVFVARNMVLFGLLAVIATPALLAPKHVWIRVVQKLAYCGAVVTAFAGLSFFRERD